MDKKGTHNVKILTKNKTNAHFSNIKMRVLEKDIIFLNLLVDPTRGENEIISQLRLHNYLEMLTFARKSYRHP